PAQTLTDKEYQIMRDAAVACIRAIGVDTGGSNIQFAVHPETGRLVVIEMNPRVSRSSALASKATGFPIAKIAAKLAVGYTPDAHLRERLRVPNADRLWHVGEACRRGMPVEQVTELTRIDPWFLRHVEELLAEEHGLFGVGMDTVPPERLRALKQQGFADARL